MSCSSNSLSSLSSPKNDVPHPQSQQSQQQEVLPPSPPPHQSVNLSATRPPSPEPSDSSSDLHPLFTEDVLNNKISSTPPVHGISAPKLAAAIDYHYSSSLPEVDSLFPWLHGLHDSNVNQRAFLDPSRKAREKLLATNSLTPFSYYELDSSVGAVPSSVRGLLVVKVGSQNSEGTLIGTAFPDEILCEKEPEIETDDFSFEASSDPTRMDLDEKPQSAEPSDSVIPSRFLPRFINLDPVNGISLRNFQIQIAKWATVSDIVLYVSDESERANALEFGRLISLAQINFREENPHVPKYVTCVVEDDIHRFLDEAPHIIAIPPKGISFDENDLRLKNWDSNFLFHEGIEMSMMSSASVIGNRSENGGAVWLGNTADIEGHAQLVYDYVCAENVNTPESKQAQELLLARNWTLYVRCAAQSPFPSISVLDQHIREALTEDLDAKGKYDTAGPTWSGTMIDFPSSGTLAPYPRTEDELYAIVSMCKLLYVRTQAVHKNNGAGALIFCNDGYTETSLLALAYLIYSTGVSASEAWVDLHSTYHRPFFSFPIDSAVITSLQPILLKYSPALPGSAYDENYGAVYNKGDLEYLSSSGPWEDSEEWFEKMDGSFPSRILPHMYLGSLVHADNPGMLAKIGIKRVISVGETLSWVNYSNIVDKNGNFTRTDEITSHVYDDPYPGISKVMYIDNIQDDGVDPLTECLSNCIDFLDEAYRLGEPTLVHCRVGVSRSATVCIAEVMKRLGVGLPRAYLFVRVRRLNVIIQPHLRFMFELVKWEEKHRRSGKGWLREVDWPVLCREIAVMNRAYIPS